MTSWYLKDHVRVTIADVELEGVISGFPSKRVEYAQRPVIVKIGPAEYVTVDIGAIKALGAEE